MSLLDFITGRRIRKPHVPVQVAEPPNPELERKIENNKLKLMKESVLGSLAVEELQRQIARGAISQIRGDRDETASNDA